MEGYWNFQNNSRLFQSSTVQLSDGYSNTQGMNTALPAGSILNSTPVPPILQQTQASSGNLCFPPFPVGSNLQLGNTLKLAQADRERALGIGPSSQVLGLEVGGANSSNSSLTNLLALLQQSGKFAPQVWQSMSSYHSVGPALLDSTRSGSGSGSNTSPAQTFYSGSFYDLTSAKQQTQPYLSAPFSRMEHTQVNLGSFPAPSAAADITDLPSPSGERGLLAVKMSRAREKQGSKWMKEASQKQKPPGLSNTGQGNQVVAFRYFLEEEQSKGVVRIKALNALQTEKDLSDQRNPLGLEEWEVRDVDQWWTDVQGWFEDDPNKFNFRAFFMMLRRFGFKPFNKAPAPASSGLDYGLKNREARRHGYVYDTEVFERYCQSRKAIARYCKKKEEMEEAKEEMEEAGRAGGLEEERNARERGEDI